MHLECTHNFYMGRCTKVYRLKGVDKDDDLVPENVYRGDLVADNKTINIAVERTPAGISIHIQSPMIVEIWLGSQKI
jgi:hypothetical protein